MKTFGTPEQRERIDRRFAQVREWLLATPAKDNEDRVSRLRALQFVGAETQDAAKELLDTQRADGGWAQLAGMESDAYATATALLALPAITRNRLHRIRRWLRGAFGQPREGPVQEETDDCRTERDQQERQRRHQLHRQRGAVPRRPDQRRYGERDESQGNHESSENNRAP